MQFQRRRGKVGVRYVLALADAGFDYLFNSVKWWDFKRPWLLEQYEAFRHIAPSIGFPESHDTDRLVSELLAAGIRGSEIERHYRHAYALKSKIERREAVASAGRKRDHQIVDESRDNEHQKPSSCYSESAVERRKY